MKKNIVEIVTELTGQVPVAYSGELKAIKCFMHDDSKPSLVLYPATNSFFCYPCSQGGDIYRFVSAFKGISYKAAKEYLDGESNFVEDMTELLDGLHVKEDINYKNELNIKVSQIVRDILIRKPEVSNNAMKFFSYLDEKVLKDVVTHDILKQVIEKAKELENA